MIKLDTSGAVPFLSGTPDPGPARREAERLLEGSDPAVRDSGWLRLPERYCADISAPIKVAASKIRGDSDVLVVIGAGGSFLGAKAAYELLSSTEMSGKPELLFAGSNMSGDKLERVISRIDGRDFSVNVISKSGSTMEPLAAFQVLLELLRCKYGSLAYSRIYVTTDPSRGPLRRFADESGSASFAIPDDVGGRYSVLTAVGLLPMAAAGIDIDAVMAGALDEVRSGAECALEYASLRQALYRAGKSIEILGFFEPDFAYAAQWWRQLFGESEGKLLRGVFPSTCEFTTDLHSMGQYIQEGERGIFETLVSFGNPRSRLTIPEAPELGSLACDLSGRRFSEINEAALSSVAVAHISGGVPVMRISAPAISPESFGALVYFFERSCAVSALLSGVCPFDQPGVEAYKNNLYNALGICR